MEMKMNYDELRSAFIGVRIFRKRGKYDAYKVLLQVYSLGSYYSEGKTEWKFSEVYSELQEMFKCVYPYPEENKLESVFIGSSKETWWEISSTEAIDFEKEYSFHQLTGMIMKGSFSEEIQAALEINKKEIPRLCRNLLYESFPVSLHEYIMAFTRFNEVLPPVEYRKEEEAFRNGVLAAYDNRCAVCGEEQSDKFDIRAVHIKWSQAGGLDTIGNGIAMCTVHQDLYTLGNFGISKDLRVVLSSKIEKDSLAEKSLKQYHGKQLRVPVNPLEIPRVDHTDWHWKNVFRKPVRFL